MMNARYERRQVARWMLFLDATAALLMVASMLLIAWNAYDAGFAVYQEEHRAARGALWALATYLSLGLVGMGWLIPRYFKDRLKEL